MVTTEPQWLDGPRLVCWLEGKGLFSMQLQVGGLARRVSDWKKGTTANVFTADRVLTRLGLHISEIPDELWVDSPLTGRPIEPVAA